LEVELKIEESHAYLIELSREELRLLFDLVDHATDQPAYINDDAAVDIFRALENVVTKMDR
jgi:hypothetical protein